ncbi:MAG: chemotaxis protein MotB [Desulfobacteraceae bacterium Eth-SRB1]|nr:MAG: chemotaxis protein MotB [Desulfobacteraceae bacterium Eth-SRB1]
MEEESRKSNKKKEAPAAGWEMIYCSLVLIIVALFAMLVSYSTIKEDKITNFREGKGLIPEGGKPDKASDTLKLSPDISVDRGKSVMPAVKSLEIYLSQIGLNKSVSLEKIEKGFRVIFGSNVLFPSGKAEINKEAYPCLDEMIKITENNPFSVKVEGHTDNVPINTPEFPSNWELSTARAVNILRYLLEKGELPADKLAAVGFSKYHPVASNAVSEGRQRNRRVEFYFKIDPEVLDE